MQDCRSQFNETYCSSLEFPGAFGPARCDTTEEIAEISSRAMANGKYSGWTTTLSYMQLRSIQETTGFISLDKETNSWRCVRSAELYEAITCPEDHGKKSKAEVERGCHEEGLICQDSYQCVCSPCYLITECIDAAEVFGRCVSYSVLLPSIHVPIAVLSIASCLCIVHHKSGQLVKQAKKAAENERELNEFISHEVRNPLSAALSASTFVNSVVHNHKPIEAESDERTTLKEDAVIIEFSLRFINDLLRSIPDLHRAANDQMELAEESVGILYDIFEPVSSMIYVRDTSFDVILECPEHLTVRTDRLRVQQVVLNLGRNAAKFVDEGFVKLHSGPGIQEKREQLFNRFQTSLDTLAQGTGVGLNLCKNLVDLTGCEISLDETYNSGYKSEPGTRIVLDLKKELYVEGHDQEPKIRPNHSPEVEEKKVDIISMSDEQARLLPVKMSVLFVDDDRILRKQATRAIGNLLPDWTVCEAALTIVDQEHFDIIFMDQYRTSIEKVKAPGSSRIILPCRTHTLFRQTMLGTETVRILRSKGNRSIICGLSANNLGYAFKSAGADAFILKPFRCRKEELVPKLTETTSLGQDCSTSGQSSKSSVETDPVSSGDSLFGDSYV